MSPPNRARADRGVMPVAVSCLVPKLRFNLVTAR